MKYISAARLVGWIFAVIQFSCWAKAPFPYFSADRIVELSHGSFVKVQRSLCNKELD